ncbi:MAG: methylmalonyl-CoA epimerase [Chloroflexi bacterium]|nr:MAG: methylmalonyl-CoA epimerase [Chloroflexota bacterium]RLC97295.1 MAG: methylmalonyl-CoA epimerase [Chloroflexota bacterium]
MIVKVNHIGIAVNSIEEAAKPYIEALGLRVKEIEMVEDQKVKVAVIPVGDTRIELLESTDPEGPIAKHIRARGEGLHHLALQVNDIESALQTLEQAGVALIDKKPRIGAGNNKIAFLHPKGTKALIELVEPQG